jgi:hypothetical protein
MVLKARHGAGGARFPLTADLATCHFTDRSRSAEDYIDLGG